MKADINFRLTVLSSSVSVIPKQTFCKRAPQSMNPGATSR
jgi:hypothetical protein